MSAYPEWIYYPNSAEPPPWAHAFLHVVAGARESIDSGVVSGLNSDAVLAQLRPGLEALGYEVEGGKAKAQKIRRPVLYGEQGLERVSYEIDAWHEELGIVVEVEAGRGTMGNAVYRDLVRTPLIVNARFLALGVMREYHYGVKSIAQSYRDSKALLDAVYASGRLKFPFEGILLFGY